MSIKRYNISGLHPHIIESKDGFMVYYEDYARLKAQVERLTKAGDVMANRLMYQGYHLTIPQWNEAKDLYPRA